MAVLAVFLSIGNIYFFFTYCDSNVDFSSNVSFSFLPSSVISSSDFLTVFSDTSLSDTGTPESFTYPSTGKNTCTMSEDASSEPKGLFRPCKMSNCYDQFPV